MLRIIEQATAMTFRAGAFGQTKMCVHHIGKLRPRRHVRVVVAAIEGQRVMRMVVTTVVFVLNKVGKRQRPHFCSSHMLSNVVNEVVNAYSQRCYSVHKSVGW